MCGIAGIIGTKPISQLADKLTTLSRTLAHRGPDDEGFLTWAEGRGLERGRDAERIGGGQLALVHRRLSIFDLSPSGWQPMLDARARIAIVFNGEIYNHPELRAELEREGERFTSQSDTEVLIAVLKRHWIKGLDRLIGMYAFACLDLDRRAVLIARDPFGIKPLHYTMREGQLAFASEIRPLLEIGAARPVVDRRALFRFLRHAVTNDQGETLFADVAELEPGHLIEVDLQAPMNAPPARFWRPASPRRPRSVSPADAAAELRCLLERSVELHMRADVPVAAALSGGIDSSGIVGLMRQRLGPGPPIAAFTYVADDAQLSELGWAETAATEAGARINEVHLRPDELIDELDTLIGSQEQPFTTTSMWAQSHVCRAVHAAGFKIMLEGQGGDECFAGYPVFRAARLEGLLRHGRLAESLAFLKQLPDGRGFALLQGLAPMLPKTAQGPLRRLVGRNLIPGWLDAGYFAASAAERTRLRPEAHSPLAATLALAVSGDSLPMLLRYGDRNAMAVSVENRVPFLTTDLANFALSLPDAILISPDGTLKHVLREALRGAVPDAVLDRRDKIGFRTPEAQWFGRSSAVRRIAASTAQLPLPPCFHPKVRDAMKAVGEGRAPFAAHVWRAMIVTRWADRFQIDFAPEAAAGESP